MNLVHGCVVILLGGTVLCCWVGVLGMWRMREPIQALHYLALPASLSVVALSVAVFLQEGVGQVALKTALIAVIVLGINSVVSHATGRAFYVRERKRTGDVGPGTPDIAGLGRSESGSGMRS